MYRLTKGLATESFGIECARLAGIAEGVLETAAQHADRMRVLVEEKTKRSRCVFARASVVFCRLVDTEKRARKALKLLGTCSSGSIVDAKVAMEQLRCSTLPAEDEEQQQKWGSS